MNLAEKYRPQTWQEVVGQDKLVADLLTLRDTTGLGGNAFFLSGKSGTGKTTIAKLIAAEVADDHCVDQIHAYKLTSAVLKHIDESMNYRGFGRKGGRAWIIDECHLLTKEQVGILLDLTEPIPDHIIWIFTTTETPPKKVTKANQKAVDRKAVVSRCHHYQSQNDLLAAFAARAKEIAVAEGLDGRPLEFYLERVRQNRNNLRAVIQEVQEGKMRT